MNQGPLPGTGGLPRPLHDTADGRINYNNTLLGNIEPYAYGKPGYLSSQTAYLNIPHRIQKIVPPLYLPEPDHAGSFKLSHPIAEGDVAFVMRLNRHSEVCSGMSNKAARRAGFETAVDPFINLCTLNYILAGLQICTLVPEVRDKWDMLMHHLDSRRFKGSRETQYDFTDLQHVVENLIRPFGIVHGKENQGGQSEVDPGSVQWPVSFVASLVLDGKDSDIVNVWHNHNISAGDDLVFRLKLMPLPPGGKYTLNHYSLGIIEKTFTPSLIEKASKNNFHTKGTGGKITHVWQLVPDVFSLNLDDGEDYLDEDKRQKKREEFAHDLIHSNVKFVTEPAFRKLVLPWQHAGYWHIVRTQVQSKRYGADEYYYNDMALNLRLGHIDSTFQPVYCAYDIDKESCTNVQALWRGILEAERRKWEKTSEGIDAIRNTNSGMGGIAADAGKRGGRSLVVLESVYEEAPQPEPPRKRQAVARFSVHPSLLAALRGEERAVKHSISVPLPEVRSVDAGSVEAGPVEAGPVEALQSQAPAEDSGVFEPARALHAEEVPAFTVAKPALKAKKPAKKGVITSSLLGVDGGVSQEQSRML